MEDKRRFTANIKLYTENTKDNQIIEHWKKFYSRLPFITYLLTMVEKQVDSEYQE